MKYRGRQIFKRTVFILAIAVFCANNVFGQEDFNKKLIEESFDANENDKLVLTSKFGDINILTSDDDQVSFKVDLTIDTNSEMVAEKFFNNIDIQINKSGNTISAKTVFKSGLKGIKDYKVNYTIYMPPTIETDINHKFGNLYIENISDEVKIDLGYGNYKIDKLGAPDKTSFFKLDYANGEVDQIMDAKLILNYSTMNIKGNAGKLRLESTYSKLNAEICDLLSFSSKYDRIEIDEINDLNGEGTYSHFKFEEVSGNIEITYEYGSLDIDYVKPGFENINIDSKYGDTKISIDSEAAYALNGEAKYGKIHYPDNYDVREINEISTSEIHGVIGYEANVNSQVTIFTEYGNVRLF